MGKRKTLLTRFVDLNAYDKIKDILKTVATTNVYEAFMYLPLYLIISLNKGKS